MSDTLTRAGLPLITGVKTAGLVNRALRGYFGSELSPFQFSRIDRVAGAFTDEEEWIIVATTGVEGAEGHRHGDVEVQVQDTESLCMRTAHTHNHTHRSVSCWYILSRPYIHFTKIFYDKYSQKLIKVQYLYGFGQFD